MPQRPSPRPDATSPWPALWALVIGFFMILVDSTIVTVATPALMRGLGADVSSVVWVTSAYLLAYAVPLLVTGRLGDRFGPKNVYLVGLTVFTLSSLWCGLSTSVGMLVAARTVQGLGAALMSPQTMAVITRTFAPDARGAAMGLWGATAGVATLAGPLAGGLLVDSLGWEWIFFVNVPIGVVAFVAAYVFVPRLDTRSHSFDLIGVVLSAVGLFCLVFGLEEAQAYDWGVIAGPVTVWRLIVGGLLVLGLFVWWQHRNRAEPLVPLGLFADRNFSAANLAITAMGFVTTSMTFPMMLYTQTARGLTPTQSALFLLPTAVLSGVLAPVVGKIIDRKDPKPLAIAGFLLLTLGLVVQSFVMSPRYSVLWLLVPATILGLANAGIWGPLSVSATRNLPPQRAGAGAGVYNTTRQLGAVLGSAAVASLMEARLAAELGGSAAAPGVGATESARLPEAVVAAFSAAMAQTMWLPAGAAVLGVLAAVLLLPRARAASQPVLATRPGR